MVLGRFLVALCMGLGFLALPVAPAEAHRDGCHRWHSCPSDSGSYVCGDLGYWNECPGGKPAASEPDTAEPDVEEDYDPPSAPRLGRAESTAGGRVTFRVRAEEGAKVRVDTEAGRRVASSTATGASQKITFRDKTGKHVYTVTATDKAGNESIEATKKVTVDATAPKLSDVAAIPGTSATGASAVSFTSEPGATWTLVGAGSKPLRGTVKTKVTRLQLWLRDGSYTMRLTVRDGVGNTSRKSTRMKVQVKRPLLQVRQVSAVTAGQLSYVVTGTPRSTGRLALQNLEDVAFRVDDRGSSTIALTAADGAYGPGQVTLTDFAGRRVTQAVPRVVVDTTAPDLHLSADQSLAKTGTLAVTVSAEPGATVQVKAALQDATLDETFTASSAPTELTRTPAPALYTVTATARDAFGNTTTRQVDVEVVVPATPAEIAVGLGILLVLLALPVVAGIVGWRQRQRIRGWWTRRAALARHRAAAATYQRQLAAHKAAYLSFQAADAAWQRTEQHLATLVRVAETYRPTPESPIPIQLKRGEVCYGAFAATMIEERSRQGVTTLVDVCPGSVIITSQRVSFLGPKNRDWLFAKLEQVQAQPGDLTLLSVSNRKNSSGVRLAQSNAEQFRLQLDLALADNRGTREAVISKQQQQLRTHQMRRPAPPTPPQEPPEPPTAHEFTTV